MDRQMIQHDIDQVDTWSARWQMEFNLDNCELISFGRIKTDEHIQ